MLIEGWTLIKDSVPNQTGFYWVVLQHLKSTYMDYITSYTVERLYFAKSKLGNGGEFNRDNHKIIAWKAYSEPTLDNFITAYKKLQADDNKTNRT